MKMTVASFESLSHASVQASLRIFDGSSLSRAVSVTKVAQNLSKYDGGSDLDLSREILDRTQEQEDYLQAAALMACAKTLTQLSTSDVAAAARLVQPAAGDSMQTLLQNTSVPKIVKDALQAVQNASATVVGTDGHRRQCRHEGVAYMETFGPPLIFLTPNVADTQHPLLPQSTP